TSRTSAWPARRVTRFRRRAPRLQPRVALPQAPDCPDFRSPHELAINGHESAMCAKDIVKNPQRRRLIMPYMSHCLPTATHVWLRPLPKWRSGKVAYELVTGLPKTVSNGIPYYSEWKAEPYDRPAGS